MLCVFLRDEVALSEVLKKTAVHHSIAPEKPTKQALPSEQIPTALSARCLAGTLKLTCDGPFGATFRARFPFRSQDRPTILGLLVLALLERPHPTYSRVQPPRFHDSHQLFRYFDLFSSIIESLPFLIEAWSVCQHLCHCHIRRTSCP
jgi:hypothetical protein